VTGAQYFDEWFCRRPSATGRLLQNRGLADRPILMYMCSSNLYGPNERVSFEMDRVLRRSRCAEIAGGRVLIRPYPRVCGPVARGDFSHYGNVVVWPSTGEYAITESAKRTFYDSVVSQLAVVA